MASFSIDILIKKRKKKTPQQCITVWNFKLLSEDIFSSRSACTNADDTVSDDNTWDCSIVQTVLTLNSDCELAHADLELHLTHIWSNVDCGRKRDYIPNFNQYLYHVRWLDFAFTSCLHSHISSHTRKYYTQIYVDSWCIVCKERKHLCTRGTGYNTSCCFVDFNLIDNDLINGITVYSLTVIKIC